MSNRPSSTRTKATSARVAQARNADSSNRWWIIAAVAVVIAGALIVALVVSTRAASDTVTSGVPAAGFNTAEGAPADLVYGTVQVTGAPLADLPDAAPGQAPPADPAVGQAVPALTGQKFNGEPITIATAGKPKLVMFVAHWCPHCQAEVPVLVKHLGGQLPADVDLFGVATGTKAENPNFPPGDWLRRESWPIPTLVDDANSTAAQAYGLSSYPFFVAVDRDGKVVERQSGELSVEQFESLITAARG
jgi:cytochrome c biogenesis protein CcmG/thiol:disulfide interchange protein DsbE